MSSRWLVLAPRGLEAVLQSELESLNVPIVERNGTLFVLAGDIEAAYQVCLWSRVASRALASLGRFEACDPDAIYDAAKSLQWPMIFDSDSTFAVSCAGSRHHAELNTHYLALRVKDAVVDRFRDEVGTRPSVDTERPQLRLHLHVGEHESELSVELTQDPLHRRGYRPKGARAPLRENLAAGLLLLAGAGADRSPVVDPMCGSGTLLVEAALLLQNVAPGLLQARLSQYHGHDRRKWERLVEEARTAARPTRATQVRVFGYDRDSAAVAMARAAAERAGVNATIQVQLGDIANLHPPVQSPGIVVTNPPYGERLADDPLALVRLYEQLGDTLRRQFLGWRAFVFSGSESLLKHVGLKSEARYRIMNGPIGCQLVSLPIREEPVEGGAPAFRAPTKEAEMFRNRLRKNQKRLAAWARREQTNCYRLYDRDIPEYNLAVDRYGDAAQVFEYRRPAKIDPHVAERRLRDAAAIVEEVLGIEQANIHAKVRERQRQGTQYERRGRSAERFVVQEGDWKFLVNLQDYLDTGLFLDDRALRKTIAREMTDRGTFLNLFAYTCTASVAAATAGASTTSVDLSQTYLGWGRENFGINGISEAKHQFVRMDCLQYVAQCEARFDCIYLAPPTFSRSKAMADDDFDLQRDHPKLVLEAARLLKPEGRLLFATHARQFEFRPPSNCDLVDISQATRAFDFPRSPHQVWWIKLKSAD